MAGKSGFGKQHYSHRESFPEIGFTKGTMAKTNMTYDHLLSKFDKTNVYSPGPGKYSLPALHGGKQADFTTVSSRDPSSVAHGFYNATPAAGFYTTQSHATTFGRHVGSLTARPCYSFGSSTKFMHEKVYVDKDLAKSGPSMGTWSPGPKVGQVSSFGKQTNSRRETGSNATFGRGKRWMRNQSTSEMSPGPGSYDC